ncbi:hypothetical protein QRX50_31495 [Amycolatopsis carbonis]|uniref:Uncharacterized protein n=1 Tax=Amycolatopsis carbonis TaxID=715471 RepID=A0A9Y2MPF9_9PSEU|nr:hypothetical protein [Amycolatopsis sp. 2-15]WIX75985.1 hypothetical protein QRX50_31495 [Amycolatopsis sp. 2-15]
MTAREPEQLAALGRRVQQMASDPELTGELLAVGVAMAAIIDAGVYERLTLENIQNLAFGASSARPWHVGQLRTLLWRDARRYKPPAPIGKCGAPTPRKPRCGHKANRFALVTDWATGERHRIEACSKHGEWFDRTHQENRAAKPEIGGPRPYANTGGKLARHFPEIDWPHLWRTFDSSWKAMPEREPAAPTTPRLRVLATEPRKRATPRKTSGGTAPRRDNRGLFAVPTLEER